MKVLIACILGCILGTSISIGMTWYTIDKPKFATKFFHDVLGWHKPDDNNENIEFDGCSFICKCKYCGKRIMQDSQGNWF